MKASDIIRNVLDLIDHIDCAQQAQEMPVAVVPIEEPVQTGADSRFKHIFAMLSAERSDPAMYDNSPNETIAGIDAVTKDASGGQSAPKHPSDIRTNAPSLYPNYGAR